MADVVMFAPSEKEWPKLVRNWQADNPHRDLDEVAMVPLVQNILLIYSLCHS